jgi:fatty acid desaturase
MNVKKYVKEHECFIKNKLNLNEENFDFSELKKIHQQKIEYIQNERIAHLLVTLFFGLYLLIAIGFSAFKSGPEIVFLIILLFVLVVFYVFHYFFLENSIQGWYKLMDEIDKKIKKD